MWGGLKNKRKWVKRCNDLGDVDGLSGGRGKLSILKSRIWLIRPDVKVICGMDMPNISQGGHFYAQLLTSGMPFLIVLWHI